MDGSGKQRQSAMFPLLSVLMLHVFDSVFKEVKRGPWVRATRVTALYWKETGTV